VELKFNDKNKKLHSQLANSADSADMF